MPALLPAHSDCERGTQHQEYSRCLPSIPKAGRTQPARARISAGKEVQADPALSGQRGRRSRKAALVARLPSIPRFPQQKRPQVTHCPGVTGVNTSTRSCCPERPSHARTERGRTPPHSGRQARRTHRARAAQEGAGPGSGCRFRLRPPLLFPLPLPRLAPPRAPFFLLPQWTRRNHGNLALRLVRSCAPHPRAQRVSPRRFGPQKDPSGEAVVAALGGAGVDPIVSAHGQSQWLSTDRVLEPRLGGAVSPGA